MEVAGYLRVSTDRQAEHGHGLDVQRASIDAWAERSGHTVTLWTKDEGMSGSNGLDTRRGLLEAVQAIRDDVVGGLVVYRLDRLARDLVLQETLLGMIWKDAGSVFSTMPGEDSLLTPGGDADDKTRNLLRQVMGAVAEFERATIRMRMRSGKLAKKARGGYLGGKLPFGYRQGPGGKLVPDESEQKALRRMADLRAAGATLQAICDTLTTEGHPTKHGGRWHTSVVGKMVGRDDLA
jgi:DNA invertase Pin-like site-specific DNA recombinase